EGKTLEVRIAGVAAVRRHHARLADLERSMHHLVLVCRRAHRLVGAILPAHEHVDLGTKRLFVEVDRLFGAAVKKQVGLNLHDSILLGCGRFYGLFGIRGTAAAVLQQAIDIYVDINIISACQTRTTKIIRSRSPRPIWCATAACVCTCIARPGRWRGVSTMCSGRSVSPTANSRC